MQVELLGVFSEKHLNFSEKRQLYGVQPVLILESGSSILQAVKTGNLVAVRELLSARAHRETDKFGRILRW